MTHVNLEALLYSCRMVVLITCCLASSFVADPHLQQSFAQDEIVLPLIVEESLHTYWTRNKASREFQPAYSTRGTRADSLSAFAYAINRARHYKYDRALEVVDEILKQDQSLLEGWYCKCWLDFRAANIDAGLTGLVNYRQQLDAAKLEAADREIHIQRLGRLLGYADGVMQQRANPQSLQEAIDVLSDGLQGAEFQLFEKHYHQVDDRHQEIVKERGEFANQALAEAEEQQKQELAGLQKQLEDLSDAEQSLQEAVGKVREQAEKQVSELNKELDPLETQASQLHRDLREIDLEISRLSIRQQREFDRAAREDDPFRADRFRFEAARFSRAISAARFEWRSIDNELDSVVRQINTILGRITQVENAAYAELDRLSVDYNQIQSEQRKNAGRTRRASRKPKAKDSKLTSLDNRARFIGTYEPFPEESLKQWVLNQFK